MNTKKRVLTVLVMVMAAALLLPGMSLAAQPCGGKKVDGFVMLVDLSGSRGEGFQTQMSLLDRMRTAVPDYNYQAAIRSFWVYPFGSGQTSYLNYGPQQFERAGFASALGGLKGHRAAFTPLGPAISDSDADFGKMQGTKALVIISDFKWSNKFGDPEGAVKALKAKYPDLVVHSVYFSRKKDPVKVAKSLAELGGGSAFDAMQAMDNETAFNALISGIFTSEIPGDSDGDGVDNCADKCPGTPAGTRVSATGCPFMNLNVQFDSGKWFIRPQYHDRIAEVADYMKANPEARAVIAGHTDSQGSARSNQVLSQKRVDSVMKYLMEKFGIDAGRMSAVGYGEDRPIADNKTSEGRQQNRRVDVEFTK